MAVLAAVPLWRDRLVVDTPPEGEYPEKLYPLQEYEARAFTHNTVVRPWARYGDRALFDRVPGYAGSWDARAEAEVWEMYLELRRKAAAPPAPPAPDDVQAVADLMNQLTKSIHQGLRGDAPAKKGALHPGALHGMFPRAVGHTYAARLAGAAAPHLKPC